MNPYALAEGEGRSYEWHDVVFTIKAAAPETGGAFALWEVTTRPGEEPHVHGAAGWQMNSHAYRHTQTVGFRYCSDTRGTHPFIPVIRAEIVACPHSKLISLV